MPKKQPTLARKARAAAREGEKFTTALRRLSSGPQQWEFSGEIFQWRGPAPYYFVAMPEEGSRELKAAAGDLSYYRGVIRIRAWIGDTEWPTSLFPKDGRYLVPLRDSVRKPLELADGDVVTIRLAVVDRSRPAKPKPPRPPRRPVTIRRRTPIDPDELRIVPANEASWEDLQAVFGDRGAPAVCWCQRYKMQPKEGWRSVGADGLAARLREQTSCGKPDSATTTGLVAYLGDEPVGWCSVDPRSDNGRLRRNCRIPWDGRSEDKADDSVWAVTCFVTRVGFRRCGVSYALAAAAVDFARQRGARALEGYPSFSQVDHFGTPGAFAAAGLVEVSRPTPGRNVMRIDFD
ncbi:MAG TPA: DUF1905 domain-containing protein [Mycobacteriales bacterium]|nr:DUF1905 domain-containing protein [Mycobacteriales bacterium]